MEYLFACIIVFLVLFFVKTGLRRKRQEDDKLKMEQFAAKGFPVFSETEQLEMIYDDDFGLLHDRLNVRSFSSRYLDKIISVSKEDLKEYIMNCRDIVNDKNVKLNQMDGFWVEEDEHEYLYHYRERGQIQSTERYSNKENLIQQFVNDMVWIIPKYSESNLETTLIKR